MLEFALTLLAFALLLAALAPLLMAGGACIAAFMLGRQVLPNLAVTLLCVVTLLASAWAVVANQSAAADKTASVQWLNAILLAAPVWLVYLASKHFLLKPQT
jgi:hypothetical protein